MGAGIGLGLNYKDFLVGLKRVESELKGFKKTAEGWSKNLANVTQAATGLFAMNQFGSYLKSAAQKAMESELNIKKLNAVLTATGGAAGLSAAKLDEIGSSLSAVTNFSKATILEAERIVLTFKGIKGDNFEKTMNLAADMADTFSLALPQAATMLSKALEMPSIGLKNLRRVGVSFTDQQVEMIKKMDEAGNLAGAQSEMFKILAGQFGGVASAAGDTASGKLLQFEKTINGIKKSIGELVMAALMPLIDILQKVVNWYRELEKPTKTIVNITIALTAGIAALLPIVMGLAAALPLLGAAFASISWPITGIVAGVALVVAGAVTLYTKWNEVVTWFRKIWANMVIIVTDSALTILRAVNGVSEVFGVSLYQAIAKVQAINLEARQTALSYAQANLIEGRAAREAAAANGQLAGSFVELKKQIDTNTIAGIGEKLKELRSQLETSASTAERVELVKSIEYWEARQKAIQETGRTLTELWRIEGKGENKPVEMGPLKKPVKGEFEMQYRTEGIVQGTKETTSKLTDIWFGYAMETAEIAGIVTDAFQNAFDIVGQKIVAGLKLASDGLQGFLKVMIETVTKLISMALSQSIANAIVNATTSATATGPAAIFTQPAFISTAVGGVLAAFAAIPKFARGGIATRPTLGIFGEAGPEALVPLDRAGRMGFGSDKLQVAVVGSIQGRELRIANKYAERNYTLKTGRK